MAQWYDKLYIGQKAALMFDRIYQSVEQERFLPGVFLITLSSNPKEQLDIFDSIYLYMPALRRRLQPVIGIAAGREEALTLFQAIAKDVYRKTNSLNIRAYFEERIRPEE